MSLPSDFQHIADLMLDFCVRHDVSVMKLCLRMTEGEVFFNQVEISHREGANWNLGSRDRRAEQIGHDVQDAIIQSIRNEEKRQNTFQSQLDTAERSLQESRASVTRLRDLIPPPLIELAKCAPSEDEIQKEDLNWIPEDDDLPF